MELIGNNGLLIHLKRGRKTRVNKILRKITSSIYLTEHQHTALNNLSEITGVSVSEYIRRGIDIILEEAGKE